MDGLVAYKSDDVRWLSRRDEAVGKYLGLVGELYPPEEAQQ